MLPAVTRTATAAITALALALGAAAPAHALGKNERNVLKGVFAAVLIHELVKQGRANAQPAPAPIPVQPVPHPGYQANVAAAAFYEFSPQARRMIQQRLAAYGYYRGGIDGKWGPGTAAAVQAYARDVNSSASLASRDGTIRLYNHLIG
ncbi:MAG: peptidoglycan-binding domain-containing protein [Gemmobacter sp.]|uniref:peptidoglycan-binding domain-containing protein n=1 Tax=Gemmobacter sp. TaxID=1898957 RepID=UPI00391CECB2